MSRLDIKKHVMERNGFCRGCDKSLTKGDHTIYTYSMRNRGQNIFFCMDCAKSIG